VDEDEVDKGLRGSVEKIQPEDIFGIIGVTADSGGDFAEAIAAERNCAGSAGEVGDGRAADNRINIVNQVCTKSAEI
jgi:hypothetical protein